MKRMTSTVFTNSLWNLFLSEEMKQFVFFLASRLSIHQIIYHSQLIMCRVDGCCLIYYYY